MQVARRIYLYLVSYISLIIMLVGASSLLRLLFENLLGVSRYNSDTVFQREEFSRDAALLVVGTVVWAIHWWLAERTVAPGSAGAEDERRSVLRKLLVYGVLLTSVFIVFTSLAELLWAVFAAGGSGGGERLREITSSSVPMVLVYGLAWGYYWYIRSRDNALTPEEGHAATVRRWYFYAVNFVALSVLMFQVASLGTHLWRVATSQATFVWAPDFFDSNTPANDDAWILVAAAFWLAHWIPTQRLTATSEEEQHSALRKVYLYGMVMETMAVSLGFLSVLISDLLRVIIGTDPVAGSGVSLLTAAGRPLVMAVVYGAFWAYNWSVLRWDSSLVAGEGRLQADIRRLYYSLVSLVGLAVLAWGVASMIRVLIDYLLGGNAIAWNQQAWGDQMSTAATLVIVGGPVWFIAWSRLQRWALVPGGAADRQALVRRVYLYLVLFGSVVSLLGGAAWLLYGVLLGLSGGFAPQTITDISWALGVSVAAGALLAYHLNVMLGDQRAAAAEKALAVPQPAEALAVTEEAAAAIVLVQGAGATDVGEVIAALRKSLHEGSHVEVFAGSGVTPAELTNWLMSRPAPGPVANEPLPEENQPAGTVGPTN